MCKRKTYYLVKQFNHVRSYKEKKIFSVRLQNCDKLNSN